MENFSSAPETNPIKIIPEILKIWEKIALLSLLAK